jgi:hypothetical protein
MEVLAKAQGLVVEHAFTIGICLLVALLLAGLVWFSISSSKSKSQVLENKARVNDASMESPEVPPQEYVEEMARRDASRQEVVEPEGDNTTE